MVGIASVVITPPSRRESAPIVALTATPAAIASSMHATPFTVESGDPRLTRRRMMMVATTTSSTFPTVWPTADPSGSAP